MAKGRKFLRSSQSLADAFAKTDAGAVLVAESIQRRTKVCQLCGEKFVPVHPGHRCCSREHAVEFKAIIGRARELRDLAHSVFVSEIPDRVWFWRKESLSYRTVRGVFFAASKRDGGKDSFFRIAQEGRGREVEAALKFAWTSPKAFTEACEALDIV